jgi:hypothetical protein
MCSLADDMASTGTPLRDDELVSYILTGLDEDYNSVYNAVITRVEPITPSESYVQLLGFKQHLQLQQGSSAGLHSSANSASRGCGMTRGRATGFHGRERGCSHGTSRGGSASNRTNNASNSRPQCRVCFKIGHTAATCWHRFDEEFVPEQ